MEEKIVQDINRVTNEVIGQNRGYMLEKKQKMLKEVKKAKTKTKLRKYNWLYERLGTK